MKFGKQLKQTVAESLPEWQPNFMDYKDLKKRINGNVCNDAEKNSDSSNDGTARSVNEKPNTAEFLKALRAEVEKVNNFYLDMEEDFIIRFQFLASRVDALKIEQSVDRRRVQELCRKLIEFQSELVLLESFSAINYTGFRKILKKNDKKTGSDLRNTFLLAVLDTPFFLSNSLRKLMSAAEKKLHSLDMFAKFRRTTSYLNVVPDLTVQCNLQPMLKMLENGDEASAARVMRYLDSTTMQTMRVNESAARDISSPTVFVMDSTDDHFMGIAVLTKGEKLQFHVREGQIFGRLLRGRAGLRRAKHRRAPVAECEAVGPWPTFRFRREELFEWENRTDKHVLILLITIPGFHGEVDQLEFPTEEGGEVKVSEVKKMITILPTM